MKTDKPTEDILYYCALVWACDNTPLKGEIFTATYERVVTELRPLYEPKGVRVVIVDPVEDEPTEII